ncbi:MAG: fibronectin type III domain-containing protein [Lachnospiraceae bacterium]|nr:fibronectin type III domain-containing protein [Lachnospiraceae bacterium]
MRMKKMRKQMIARCMVLVMCLISVFQADAAVQAEETVGNGYNLQNPVIAAEDGKITWDCIYFGNYWQSEYVPQSENQAEQDEGDVECTDTDGTRYFRREDGSCYKYEPIKWRVLSVNEDGTDAFLMADKCLDARPYHTTYSEEVTWETCSLRTWLNGTFSDTAFTQGEQEAIVETEIDNIRNPYYEGDLDVSAENGASTRDNIYLLSLDEITERSYGFVHNYNPSENKFSATETRAADGTDFAKSCENGIISEAYLLRTLGAIKGYVLSTDNISEGAISVTGLFGTQVHDKGHGIRPVLHLDLTKTNSWSYAGQVKQDKTEIAPDATPAVPTPTPTAQPGVTMAPGQVYPKNPVVNAGDLTKNTWDCIYFGKYYNTKFTPSVLSPAGNHDSMQDDKDGNPYLVRHEEGYFGYEPIKWRVLSINEDGTDAFLMADQVLDIQSYHDDSEVQITWAESDIRKWLGEDFLVTAFTEEEQEMIRDSQVKTADNKWSGEPGGNDTTDKVYLLSIEEALEPAYGFSSDENEGDTRRITATDYAVAEQHLLNPYSYVDTYWLRSSGSKEGCPAMVGHWGDGSIPTDLSVLTNKSTTKLGVRPVMHVNLSNTSMWSYAGQVTPKGVVVAATTSTAGQPTKKPPVVTPTPTKKPQATAKPTVKKPGKPVIKKLKNKKGKKVIVTLKKKVSGATGYQVAYATKSSMKGQKQKSFKGTKVTVKKLKKRKKYYFRVRAYTKKSGKTVYGSWGNKKNIKIKK